MSNFFLNLLVRVSRPLIDRAIKNSLIPIIENTITTEILKINKMIANEGPYDFEYPVYGNKLHLNLTMTTAPRIKYKKDLIELFFDGQFNLP